MDWMDPLSIAYPKLNPPFQTQPKSFRESVYTKPEPQPKVKNTHTC